MDRRVAQGDRRLSHEEKATKRFTLQRQKLFESRRRQFNLPAADNNDVKVVDTDESSDDEDEAEEMERRETSGREEHFGDYKDTKKASR